MLKIQFDHETVCRALRVSWIQAHRGLLSWYQVMQQIDAMQNLMVCSESEQNAIDSDVMDDTKTLWSIALRNLNA